ncbi:hypothetical protein BSKO_13285 [Bryopsis sp. KO-2023]|nr:hypothetical protein BSKO_13285 [Bryopsis sp. KO-2023]
MHGALARYSQQHLSSHSSSTSGDAGPTLSLRIPKRPLPRVKPDASKDAVGSPQWERYNLFKDVVVRAEVMGEAGYRKAVGVVYAAVGLGFLALVALAVLKFTGNLESWKCGRRYSGANVAVALMDVVVMLVGTGCYLFRVFDITRRGFRWGIRRKRKAMMNAGQFVAHTINSVLYLVTNCVVLFAKDWINYPWFKYLAVMEYTMWNILFVLFVLRSRMLNLWLDKNGEPIGRRDAILFDAPWAKHCWLMGIWVGFEVVLLMGTTYKLSDTQTTFHSQAEFEEILCTVPDEMLSFAGVIMGTIALYHCLGVFFIFRGYKQLVRKPYNLFRGTHLELRYHLLCAGTVGHLLSLSFLLLFWIRPNSCGTGVLMWFGILPCHFLMTVLSVVMLVLVMPVKPGRSVTLNLAPENPLVWREAAQPEAARNETSIENGGVVEEGGGGREAVVLQPPFCFEMAVKLWYWSLAVYGFDPATGRCFDPKYEHMSLQVALAMFDLEEYEYIEEQVCDTKVMVAWNDHTILVCFRGTYSATNVWTDLQFWRTVHSPPRGNYLLRSRPLVHKGFIKSWTASSLNHRILNVVIRIMNSGGRKFDKAKAKVFVAGHSLGGALAVLAAFDIARYCGVGGDRITCYTYGAPRVGNHAFAREYDQLVPNTWQIINDEDLIPRMPKFWVLFKHVGSKVIINQCGDMIVKPYLVEVSLYRMFSFFKSSSSVAQHSLMNYRKSFVAICEAQFMEGKGLKGGMDAMLALLEERERLLSSGLGVETRDLQKLHSLGKTIWKRRCSREKFGKKRGRFGRGKEGFGGCSAENGGVNDVSGLDVEENGASSTSSEGQSCLDGESDRKDALWKAQLL